MDWKGIIGGIIVGAVLGIAGTFFLFQGRITRLEEKINQPVVKQQPKPNNDTLIQKKQDETLKAKIRSEPQAQVVQCFGYQQCLSPDGRYKAISKSNAAGMHYQVIEIKKNIVVLTTHAQFTTANDVKAGAFVYGQKSKKFVAAYHYGHKGGYTWIGAWDVESGNFLKEKEEKGFITNITKDLLKKLEII